ncbi:MAG: OsmC family protein [Polyangiaceae bacterium]|nr:OsmC family protein [Polyangiaceae bacterium]
MVEITSVYDGDLHCTATHGPSGVCLATDAPLDNQGRGASFSPTDLVATALVTCMLTTMALRARRESLAELPGVRSRVEKHMTTEPPRRIARLPVELELPGVTYGPEARAALEHAAHTCPVRLSLEPAIEVPVRFVWT